MIQPADMEGTNPEIDFPIVEEHVDCAGTRRVFRIEAEQVSEGWVLTAREPDKDYGYEFHAFSPCSPAQALGPLRYMIRAGLATKYLDTSSDELGLTHDRMHGMISYDQDSDRVGLLVDGRFVSMQELERILSAYEGWLFDLAIEDS